MGLAGGAAPNRRVNWGMHPHPSFRTAPGSKQQTILEG